MRDAITRAEDYLAEIYYKKDNPETYSEIKSLRIAVEMQALFEGRISEKTVEVLSRIDHYFREGE